MVLKSKTDPRVESLTEIFARYLLSERLPGIDICSALTGEIIVPANRLIKKFMLRKMAQTVITARDLGEMDLEIDPSPIRSRLRQIICEHEQACKVAQSVINQ